MNLTLLFYLIAYSGGLLKALAGKPVWGVYVYFLCFYFHAPTQWWGQSLPDIRWALIASLITAFAIVLHPPKRGLRFWEFRENKWLVALSVLTIVQWPFVINSSIHGEYVFLLLKFLIFIFMVQNTVWTLKDVKRILWVNLFGGFYLAYLGISMHDGGRLGGIGTPGMESANQLGQHFALLLLAGGYLLLERFKWAHIFVAIALVMIMMALFMTESRGVIGALFLTGILAPFFIPDGMKQKVFSFGVLAVIASALLMGPQIIQRFKGMEKDQFGEMADASAGSRMVIIDAQIEMAKSSPWIGHGHRGTLLLSPEYIPEEYHAQGVGMRASHNVAMAFLVDHGIIGLFIYMTLLFSCGWRIWKVPKAMTLVPDNMREEYRLLAGLKVGCILALVCYFIAGMGSNNKKLEGDIWMFALVPLISARMARIESKQNRQERIAEERDEIGDNL